MRHISYAGPYVGHHHHHRNPSAMTYRDALKAALPTLSGWELGFATDILSKPSAKGLSPKQLAVIQRIVTPKPAPAPAATIGAIKPIVELIIRAKSKLKWPAILLSVGERTLRISIAGAASAQAGSVNVTDQNERNADGRRRWYGRISTAGEWQPAKSLEADLGTAIVGELTRFAADPVGVAAEFGHRTGRCCFCNLKLDDERSTAVGYGPICAKHYGLPWGHTAAKAITCEAVR